MSLVLFLRCRFSLRKEIQRELCFAPALVQVALEQRPKCHPSQLLAPLISALIPLHLPSQQPPVPP